MMREKVKIQKEINSRFEIDPVNASSNTSKAHPCLETHSTMLFYLRIEGA